SQAGYRAAYVSAARQIGGFDFAERAELGTASGAGSRFGDERLMQPRLDCVFLGLSITSTWGNGHATTYRGLLKELAKRGHKCTFLERDVPWYSANREFKKVPYARVELYSSLSE